MATDYILFIHGVNTREDFPQEPSKYKYAKTLFDRIQKSVPNQKRNLKAIPLYWGDVNKEAETNLLKHLQASPLWEKIWFRTFREEQILQFAGDAALYISRHIGSRVVKELKKQSLELANAQSDDRLHLVTHSWGTVILFDILFARRWDNPDVPGHEDVMLIRDSIYGVSGENRDVRQGIEVASIHTMGSPVAIFSLTNVVAGKDDSSSPSTHDITPNLQKLLEYLQEARKGKKLPWRNYVHPGDPIAYPLKQLMTNLVDGDTKYLDIQDLMMRDTGLVNRMTAQTLLPLLDGGKAHGSYWQNNQVVQEICSALKNEAPALS